MVLSWLVGIPVAIVSALRPNSFGDNVSRFLSILFLAVPGFWLAMLIVLGLLFGFGYRAPLANVALFTDPLSNLQIVVGPALVLGLGQAAYIARMARSSLLEVVREDYVRTARAKGLNGRLVIALHALPNALLPVITLSGILLGFVLAGSIPVERAFGTPGLGYAMYTAVSERDVFVMQNLVFLYSIVFVLLNILVDLTSPGSIRGSATDERHSARRRASAAASARGASSRRGCGGACACLRIFARRSPMSAFWGCVAAGIICHGRRRAGAGAVRSDARRFPPHDQAAVERCTTSAPTRSAATR